MIEVVRKLQEVVRSGSVCKDPEVFARLAADLSEEAWEIQALLMEASVDASQGKQRVTQARVELALALMVEELGLLDYGEEEQK
jgi:type III secretory pathway lipoprotein EscJ